MAVIGKKVHFSGRQHRTPEPGSKGWQRVVNRGCGLIHDEMNGDYGCSHGYTWGCESCPIGLGYMDRARAEWERARPGPPRPLHHRPAGFFWCPSVATELELSDGF